jgi:hypothetical protein
MVNRTTSESANSIQLSQKARFEQNRMTDVTFLLETIFIREEATVEQILDCLYDIGSVNIIDQRVQSRSLNQIAKWIARHSKPVFRIIALRWFKRNCPNLITDWLYTQVKFEPQKVAQVVEATETKPEPEAAAEVTKLVEAPERIAIERVPTAEIELYRQKVKVLHLRVKLLTMLLVSVTVTLGAGLIWSLERHPQATRATPVLRADP